MVAGLVVLSPDPRGGACDAISAGGRQSPPHSETGEALPGTPPAMRSSSLEEKLLRRRSTESGEAFRVAERFCREQIEHGRGDFITGTERAVGKRWSASIHQNKTYLYTIVCFFFSIVDRNYFETSSSCAV